MEPSYQEEPLASDWFERFKKLHASRWSVPESEVEARITHVPLLELLLVHQPSGQWEARLPQIQLNFSGQGPTPESAVESLVKTFGIASEHIESHPLLVMRPSTAAVEYLQQSLPRELRTGQTDE